MNTHLSQDRSLQILRYSLGVVFVWFGVLKLFNVSPVIELMRDVTPSFLPFSPLLVFVIALFEILVGASFFMKRIYRIGAILVPFYLVFVTLLTLISKGFSPFFPVLSFEGEFVIKNLVLIAACLVLVSMHKEEAQKEVKKDGPEA